MNALISILLLAPNMMFGGFILTKFWQWFVIPVFQLPPLTIGYAIGIGLIMSLFTPVKYVGGETKTNDLLDQIGYSFFCKGMILLIGWIVTLFM